MRLASSWSDDIAASVGWLGDDAARFDEPLAGVRAAAGAVAPSGEAVTAARVGLVAPDLAPLLATLVSEHDAWAAGDADRAKLMRLAQHSQLRSLTDPLRDWCLGADAQASCAALAATARVLLLALSIETGRDFEARFRPRFNLLDLLRDA